MFDFDYVRPASVADAVAALGAGGERSLLAGGQTLLPTLKQRLANPDALVDLGSIADLKGIRRDGTTLTIGATTIHAEVAASAEVRGAIPALAVLAETIGDAQVRNRGTLGGSIANNDPSADYPAAVLGLGATIITNSREIAADDYFTGLFATALQPDEIITAVRFPVPARAGYAKFAQRASRYALVGVFVSKVASGVGEVRVAVTGAGDGGVFRAASLEKALAISTTPETARGVTVTADGLLSDLHASADYRAALIPEMAARALESGWSGMG